MRSAPRNRWLLALLALCLLAVPFVLQATTGQPGLGPDDRGAVLLSDAELVEMDSVEPESSDRRVSITALPDPNSDDADASAVLDGESAPLGVLRGRVLSASTSSRPSSPIAGAELHYEPADPSYLEPGQRSTSSTSAEDGRFELAIRLSGQNPLTISAQGHVPHLIKIRPLAESTDLGDIVLAEAVMVSGHVVDVRGHGIGGARILSVDPCSDDLGHHRRKVLERVLAVTDDDGAFHAPASPSNGLELHWTLNVLHEEYRPACLHGTVAVGSREQRPVTIVMERGASIAGRVTGLTEPELSRIGPLVVSVSPRIQLDDLQYEWEEDTSTRRVPVRPDGTFTVGGLRPDETAALSIWTGGQEKSQYTRRRTEWSVGRAEEAPAISSAIELEYLRPAILRARVVDSEGRAVERFSIDTGLSALIMAGDEPRSWMEMATFPDGIVEWVCRASDMEDENWLSVVVEGEGGRVALSWEGTAPKLAEGAAFDFGEVTLTVPEPEAPGTGPPTRTIEVLVLDRHGAPLPHAPIELACSTTPSTPLRSGRSDSAGRASFEVPADQRYRVRVDDDNLRRWFDPIPRRMIAAQIRARWTPVPSGNEKAVLTLSSPGTAGVRIRVSYGGLPLAGASLVLHWIPDAPVVCPVSGSPYDRVPREATPDGERTDGAGVWSCDAMIPGAWTALVYHPQLRMPEPFSFTLAPGDNEIELARSQTALEGRVVDANGLPVPGAMVRADLAKLSPLLAIRERDNDRMTARPGGNKEDLALRDIRYTRADPLGQFRLDGVEPGVELRALAMAPGFVLAASEPLVVEAGTTIDLGELRMARAGRVQVWIPIGTDGDIDMEAVPLGEDGDVSQARLDERWSSVFDSELVDGLQPGEWTVTVIYRPIGTRVRDIEDYIERTETIELRAGETIVIDLRR